MNPALKKLEKMRSDFRANSKQKSWNKIMCLALGLGYGIAGQKEVPSEIFAFCPLIVSWYYFNYVNLRPENPLK